jgi:beta-galactosidase
VPIVVVCDNSREPDTIPSSLADFTAYGGLHRHVELLYVPAVSLERVHVVPKIVPKSGATVSVRARLYGTAPTSADLRLHVRVTDPDGRVAYDANTARAAWTGMAEIATFHVGAPAFWSPARPSLYQCTVTIAGSSGEHTVGTRFGLRTIEFERGGAFKLNGEALFLRGTHRHQDHAGVGSGVPDDVTRREFALIKDVGANFIRLAHYQQSPLVLDLCDELGLIVWEEIQWCRGTLPTERSRDHVRTLLRTLIDQHMNHPSIAFWGLGNEVGWPEEAEAFDKESIRAMVRELSGIAHELDPSRFSAVRRTEYCADLVDVFAPSIWAGWYSGRYTEYKSSAEKLVKETPARVLHAEWGADSHPGRHSEDPDAMLAQLVTGQGTAERGLDFLLTGGQARASRDGDWSETYACNLFDWYLKEQETMRSWFAGSAQWVFKDFATPLRDDNPIPYINQKGLVERDLTLKEGYFVFQSYWADKPMVRIYAHSWRVRWGARDEDKLVKVYSNCPGVELFVNGASCGTRRRNSQDFPAAGLRWIVRFREGENHLRAVAVKDDATVTDDIRVEYQTATWGPPARLTLAEASREKGVALVEATVRDAQGTCCLDSRLFVRFQLAGDGRLLDNQGTATGSRRIQLANGRARLKVTVGPGPSVISVSAEGLRTELLPISQ